MNLGRLFKAGVKYLASADYRFLINAGNGAYDKIPDEQFLKWKFKAIFGEELNLENPKTFNEKLQWLKLYDRRPEYTMMADKVAVREYIAKTIGEEYLIPCLGVWDDPENIDFDTLPEQFVLKCNHNSGLGMYICKDKSKLNIQKVKKELKKGLEQDYYLSNREWPYKNIPRRIIAEQYMEDEKTEELRDYKLFCFDGKVRAMFIATERQKAGEEVKFDFFDAEGNHLDVRQGHPNAKVVPDIPKTFVQMKELAKKLSVGIPQVRVDFYEANGKIYFGELTFSHFAGMVPFEPSAIDEQWGDWINLPKSVND